MPQFSRPVFKCGERRGAKGQSSPGDGVCLLVTSVDGPPPGPVEETYALCSTGPGRSAAPVAFWALELLGRCCEAIPAQSPGFYPPARRHSVLFCK